jgi:hypothetical protein
MKNQKIVNDGIWILPTGHFDLVDARNALRFLVNAQRKLYEDTMP